MTESLCTWTDAVARLQGIHLPHRTETTPLERAIGRRLAAPVHAQSDYPRFRSSAMDGWALHADDLQTRQQDLCIMGEVLAGQAPLSLCKGETFAVMTGAPLPAEAAGVVPVEYADAHDGKLSWDADATTTHIREQGEDFCKGQELLERDVFLTPTRTILLASAGIDSCTVYVKPTVALLKSGDEIQADPGPYGIYDGTSACLSHLVDHDGGQLGMTEFLPDNLQKTQARLEHHIRTGTDLILTTGGVSKGTADFIPQAIIALGGTIHLHRLAIKPAKPLLVATFPNGTILVGLPGNPVSQLVAYVLAVTPLLRGRAPLDIQTFPAYLDNDAGGKSSFLTFLRASCSYKQGNVIAHVLSGQESHRALSFSTANGWVLAQGPLRADETVNVLPFPGLKGFF